MNIDGNTRDRAQAIIRCLEKGNEDRAYRIARKMGFLLGGLTPAHLREMAYRRMNLDCYGQPFTSALTRPFV